MHTSIIIFVHTYMMQARVSIYMFACKHACMHARAYVFVCLHECEYACAVYVCMSVFKYKCISMFVNTCLFVYTYVYVCIVYSLYMYLCICKCMCKYI